MSNNTVQVFTKDNFDKLSNTCDKIKALSAENIDGSLMMAQKICLADAIKEFINNPIVNTSGILNKDAETEKPAPTETEKFRKFWVVSVNNYLCGASYNGKELKEKHFAPSFRKFYFIRSWDELNHFTKRKEITNEELVKQSLAAKTQQS